MTVETTFGILLQTLAVGVVIRRLKSRVIYHVGAMIVIIAATYHGAAELVQFIAPGRNRFRELVEQPALNSWMLIVGPALLLFALCYTVTLNRVAKRGSVDGREPLSPTVMLAVTVPMFIYAAQGNTFIQGVARGSLVQALVAELLTMMLGLCGYAVAQRLAPTRRVLALIGVAAASSVFGQRWLITAEVLLVMSLLGRAGAGISLGATRRQQRRRLAALGCIAVVGMLGLSAARASSGRESFGAGSGVSNRSEALLEGVDNVTSGGATDVLLDDFVYRLDGNAFPALILERQERGVPPVGFTTIVDAFQLAIPSFLNPSKLSTDVTERNEKAYFVRHYSIREGIDYVPTLFGSLLGSFGRAGLFAAVAVLGVAFAVLDRWILSRRTAARYFLGVGFMVCALLYEQGIPAYPVTLRAALLVAIAVASARSLRRRRTQEPGPSGAHSRVRIG